VVLDVYKNIVLLRQLEELLVVLKQLNCWLCDEDVDAAFDRILSDWVVGGVRGEDGDCQC